MQTSPGSGSQTLPQTGPFHTGPFMGHGPFGGGPHMVPPQMPLRRPMPWGEQPPMGGQGGQMQMPPNYQGTPPWLMGR